MATSHDKATKHITIDETTLGVLNPAYAARLFKEGFISARGWDHLRTSYRYTGVDHSFFGNRVLYLWWNFVVDHFVPMWVAYVTPLCSLLFPPLALTLALTLYVFASVSVCPSPRFALALSFSCSFPLLGLIDIVPLSVTLSSSFASDAGPTCSPCSGSWPTLPRICSVYDCSHPRPSIYLSIHLHCNRYHHYQPSHCAQMRLTIVLYIPTHLKTGLQHRQHARSSIALCVGGSRSLDFQLPGTILFRGIESLLIRIYTNGHHLYSLSSSRSHRFVHDLCRLLTVLTEDKHDEPTLRALWASYSIMVLCAGVCRVCARACMCLLY